MSLSPPTGVVVVVVVDVVVVVVVGIVAQATKRCKNITTGDILSFSQV